MIYENFVWTPELRKEFFQIILDNYHCIDNIEEATINFVKEKTIKSNGTKRTASDIIWEIGNLN